MLTCTPALCGQARGIGSRGGTLLGSGSHCLLGCKTNSPHLTRLCGVGFHHSLCQSSCLFQNASPCLTIQVFEDILGSGNKDPSSLPATIDHLLGGVPPRSILCTGACVGGLLATLAAAWAALRWPDSDVRTQPSCSARRM